MVQDSVREIKRNIKLQQLDICELSGIDNHIYTYLTEYLTGLNRYYEVINETEVIIFGIDESEPIFEYYVEYNDVYFYPFNEELDNLQYIMNDCIIMEEIIKWWISETFHLNIRAIYF